MASNAGYATLTIIPSLRGFGASLQGQLGGAGIGAAGVATGRRFGLGVLGGVAGVGLASAILGAAGGFEAAMKRVEAATGATGLGLERLEDTAEQLGATTRFSAKDAADAMYELATAGFDVSEILGAVPRALDLAAASGIDMATAAKITTTALHGFGLEVEDLAHTNDVLTFASIATNASMQSLSDAFHYVAPIANLAGTSIEETTAAIGLLANAGLEGSMGGTALRGAFEALLNPTKQEAELIAELGLRVFDTTGAMLPLNDIIGQLETSGITTGQVLELFGQRAGPGMAALMEIGSEALRDLTSNLEGSDGTAARVAETMTEGLNPAMERMKSAAEGAAIAIGESGLLDDATKLANGVAGLFGWISELNPQILRFGSEALILTAAIAPTVWIMGKLVTGTAALINGIILAIPAVAGFGTKLVSFLGTGAGAATMVAVAGLALLAWHVMNVKKKQEEAEARARTYADALAEGGPAAIVAANRLLIENLGDLQQSYSDAGLSLVDFIDAANEGGAAITDLFNMGDVAVIDAWLASVQDGRTEVDDFTRSLVDAYSEGRINYETLYEVAEAYQTAARQAGDGEAEIRTRLRADEASAETAGRIANQQDLAAASMTNAGQAAADGVPPLEDLTDAIDDTASSTGDATTELHDWMQMMRDATAPQRDLLDAQREVHQAIADVTAALADNSRTLDLNSDDGRENYDAISGAADAWWELSDATFAETGSMAAANDVINLGRDALIRQLEQFGLTRDEAVAYVDQLGLIPADIVTAMSVDTGQATAEISAWLAREWQLGVRVTTTLPTHSPPERAAGGPLSAGQMAWVGEEGPELFVPGAAGYVIPHAASMALSSPSGDSGGSQGSVLAPTFHVYIGDRELLDIVDVRVDDSTRRVLATAGRGRR